jgi:hypothetical protein
MCSKVKLKQSMLKSKVLKDLKKFKMPKPFLAKKSPKHVHQLTDGQNIDIFRSKSSKLFCQLHNADY